MLKELVKSVKNRHEKNETFSGDGNVEKKENLRIEYDMTTHRRKDR